MDSEAYYTVWDCDEYDKETLLKAVLEFQQGKSEEDPYLLFLLVRDISWFEEDLFPTMEDEAWGWYDEDGDFVVDKTRVHYSDESRLIDWDRVYLHYCQDVSAEEFKAALPDLEKQSPCVIWRGIDCGDGFEQGVTALV